VPSLRPLAACVFEHADHVGPKFVVDRELGGVAAAKLRTAKPRKIPDAWRPFDFVLPLTGADIVAGDLTTI
jgi:hypothetical protein